MDTDDKVREAAYLRRRFRDARQWSEEMAEWGSNIDQARYQKQLDEIRVRALLLGVTLGE